MPNCTCVTMLTLENKSPVLLNTLVMGLCLKKSDAQLHLCDYAYSCEHLTCFTEHACYGKVLEEG